MDASPLAASPQHVFGSHQLSLPPGQARIGKLKKRLTRMNDGDTIDGWHQNLLLLAYPAIAPMTGVSPSFLILRCK